MYKFQTIEYSPFLKRLGVGTVIWAVLSLTLFLCIFIFEHYQASCFWAMILCIAAVFIKVRGHRFYINSVIVEDGNISIEYQEYAKQKTLMGHSCDFEFEKEVVSRSNSTWNVHVRFYVYYKGKRIITQYEIGEWKERQFIEVLKSVRKI